MTTEASGLRVPKSVRISHHALEQLRSRSSEISGVANDVLEAMVRREVSEAISAGRFACSMPRWIDRKRSKGRGSRAAKRYAWNLEESRCFVLAPLSKTGWLVVTVLRPIERLGQPKTPGTPFQLAPQGLNRRYGDAAA